MQKNSIFNIIKHRDQLSITCSSRLENIDLADEETRLFLMEKGLEPAVFAVCLGMREGMTNAVKHGHGFICDKLIHYQLVISENRLIAEIEDEGDGFDWRAARRKEPLLESDHGRGLAIIRKYSDLFWYNEKGNKLVFVIEIHPRKGRLFPKDHA
ncbi:MAG: ATP-binding protein [Thermodesulfobacteriota bacterium]